MAVHSAVTILLTWMILKMHATLPGLSLLKLYHNLNSSLHSKFRSSAYLPVQQNNIFFFLKKKLYCYLANNLLVGCTSCISERLTTFAVT